MHVVMVGSVTQTCEGVDRDDISGFLHTVQHKDLKQ